MLVFLVSILVLSLASLIAKDKDFSEKENRSLTTMPKITFDGLVRGTVENKFESYCADQFIARDFWVRAQSIVASLEGRNESSGVFRAKDGYLIQDFETPDQDLIEAQTQAINAFADRHGNVKFYMILAPTAVNVFEDKLPANAPAADQGAYIRDFTGKLSSRIMNVDALRVLRSHKDEYVYYKTDHHWTSLGAYYAYKEAANVMGLDTSDDKYEAMLVTTGFQGTLQARSGYRPRTYDDINVYFNLHSEFDVSVYYMEKQKKAPTLYDTSALERRNKYELFLGGNEPLIRINSTTLNKRNLLVIKDSYANCFIPFMTGQFQKVVVVDPRYYYEDIDELIDMEGITDVIFLYNATTLSQDGSLVPVLTEIKEKADPQESFGTPEEDAAAAENALNDMLEDDASNDSGTENASSGTEDTSSGEDSAAQDGGGSQESGN